MPLDPRRRELLRTTTAHQLRFSPSCHTPSCTFSLTPSSLNEQDRPLHSFYRHLPLSPASFLRPSLIVAVATFGTVRFGHARRAEMAEHIDLTNAETAIVSESPCTQRRYTRAEENRRGHDASQGADPFLFWSGHSNKLSLLQRMGVTRGKQFRPR